MRAAWAILAALVLGGGFAWWLSQASALDRAAAERRAATARAAAARDARPSLYRWRDAGGVLQVTDRPPKGRKSERLEAVVTEDAAIRGDRLLPADRPASE